MFPAPSPALLALPQNPSPSYSNSASSHSSFTAGFIDTIREPWLSAFVPAPSSKGEEDLSGQGSLPRCKGTRQLGPIRTSYLASCTALPVVGPALLFPQCPGSCFTGPLEGSLLVSWPKLQLSNRKSTLPLAPGWTPQSAHLPTPLCLTWLCPPCFPPQTLACQAQVTGPDNAVSFLPPPLFSKTLLIL